MLKLAKILHSKGFLITFVNTEFNHERLIRSQGSDAVRGLPSFRFETIPDGLSSPQNYDATQDTPTIAKSVDETALVPFKSLLTKINDSCSPVTCIVADNETFVVELGIDKGNKEAFGMEDFGKF
nr:7-deoxyloganetin glucosyltransferase-like [Tanacetum cinerariifolium]